MNASDETLKRIESLLTTIAIDINDLLRHERGAVDRILRKNSAIADTARGTLTAAQIEEPYADLTMFSNGSTGGDYTRAEAPRPAPLVLTFEPNPGHTPDGVSPGTSVQVLFNETGSAGVSKASQWLWTDPSLTHWRKV